MDAKTAREITRLHWIDLHAQLHSMPGQEQGHVGWMIRGTRIVAASLCLVGCASTYNDEGH
jgi:hypothetical protein